jgi:hypothetical protein
MPLFAAWLQISRNYACEPCCAKSPLGVSPKRVRNSRLKYEISEKPACQRDVGYPAGVVAWLGQQREGSLQPQLGDARRESHAGRFDQALQITRRNALVARHRRHIEPRLLEVSGDMVGGGVEARMPERAQAALAGGGMWDQRHRDEIMNVAHDHIAQLRRSENELVRPM